MFNADAKEVRLPESKRSDSALLIRLLIFRFFSRSCSFPLAQARQSTLFVLLKIFFKFFFVREIEFLKNKETENTFTFSSTLLSIFNLIERFNEKIPDFL